MHDQVKEERNNFTWCWGLCQVQCLSLYMLFCSLFHHQQYLLNTNGCCKWNSGDLNMIICYLHTTHSRIGRRQTKQAPTIIGKLQASHTEKGCQLRLWSAEAAEDSRRKWHLQSTWRMRVRDPVCMCVFACVCAVFPSHEMNTSMVEACTLEATFYAHQIYI